MSTDITTRTDKVPVHDTSEFANLLDTARFEHLWRVATAFAKSDLVPQHFRNKPENVFVATQMALRTGVDPYMFLQNCYVVAGRPGIESKLAVALLNRSGRIKGSVKYRFEGDGKKLACVAYCTEAATGELLEHRLDWSTVEAEGWLGKSGSKWKTDPQLMMQYRAAMRLIRLHFPEVLLGMSSVEELDESTTLDAKVVNKGPVASLSERITARAQEPVPAIEKAPAHTPEADADGEPHGDAWEPDEEERAQIEGQLFETHPNAAEA